MQTIDLECPQCQTMLELDAGFAGGVCRCSSCGTLMTVPSDPRRERAETLTRPDRPDAPGSSSRSRATPPPPPSPRRESAPPPPKPAARSPEPPASKPAAAKEPGKPVPPRPAAPSASVPPPSAGASLPQAAPGKDSADTQTFVTASGKTVRVSNRIAIPTARKKREVVRFSVVLVFLVIGIVVIAACIFAINALSGPSPSAPVVNAGKTNPNAAIGGYDPDVNPLLGRNAGYLGLPYTQRTILVIDTAPITSQWRQLAIDAVAPGLAGLGKDKTVQVMLVTERGTLSHPKEPRHISADDLAELAEFFANAGVPGSAPLTPALRAALDAKPSRVVIVTGSAPDKTTLSAMSDLLAEAGGVKVDAIVIEAESPELRALIEKAGGRFISYPRGVILRWLKEYDAKKEKDAEAASNATTAGETATPKPAPEK